MAARSIALFRKTAAVFSSRSTLDFVRRLSTGSATNLYLTTSSISGIPMDATKYTTLANLFLHSKERCYDNFSSNHNQHCFSKLSRGIFKHLAVISHQVVMKEKRHLMLNPSGILVKYEGEYVTDVGVPTSQVTTGTSIFVDKVVGPFACLLHLLHLGDVHDNYLGKDIYYKEIADLLHRARYEIWWHSLDEILEHPVFWSVEEKFAAIAFANILLQEPKEPARHLIPYVLDRARRPDPHVFKIACGSKIYFHLDFVVDDLGDEFQAHEMSIPLKDSRRDWQFQFSSAFHSGYPLFKSGTGYQKIADLIKFCRDILLHFGDKNFNAFAANMLKRPTLHCAVIELDRKFSLCLTIYHGLRKLGFRVEKILDIKFTC